MRDKAAYAKKLEELFSAMDHSGDGCVELVEFQEILNHSEVKAYFSLLELDVHEAISMFQLLDDGDGCIQREEFIDGVLRLKGQARSQDVIMIQHECRRIDRHIRYIADRLDR